MILMLSMLSMSSLRKNFNYINRFSSHYYVCRGITQISFKGGSLLYRTEQNRTRKSRAATLLLYERWMGILLLFTNILFTIRQFCSNLSEFFNTVLVFLHIHGKRSQKSHTKNPGIVALYSDRVIIKLINQKINHQTF